MLLFLALCGSVTKAQAFDFSAAQVSALDLAVFADDLKGFSGSFTDGVHGYLVPFDNGKYFGKIVRFDLATFSNLEELDLTEIDEDLKGFSGGFVDGTYAYLTPCFNGRWFGKVVRFELATFSNVKVLDVEEADPEMRGFGGGFHSGAYAYLVPFSAGPASHSGRLCRFDLATFSQIEELSLTDYLPELKASYHGGFADSTYGYLVPYMADKFVGTVVRFRLDSMSEVQVLDLTAVDSSLVGFNGGFTDGTYGYLVPFAGGKAARFDLATFSQVESLDMSGTDPDLKRFSGGFQDGTYGYMMPSSLTCAFCGKVARFDLATFSNVVVLDLKAQDPSLVFLSAGFSHGGFGYAVPHANVGKVARFQLA